MVWTGLSALLSHWRRRPVQLAMLLLGLSLATALWSAVQAINGEARASYDRAAAILGQDRLAQLVREDGARIDQQAFVRLRRAGWLVSPVIEGDMRFGDVRLRVLGIDPLTLPPQAQQVDVAAGDELLPFITAPGVLYAAPETAARLTGQATPPVRVAEDLPPGTVLTDIGQAQVLLGAKDKISRLLLWPDQPIGRAPLKVVAPGLTLRQPSETGDLAELTDSFHLNLTAFGFLAFAVGLFIVHSAIGLAFEQRRAVLRTLRALGMPARVLVLLLITELLIFALLAGLVGVALGYAVASALLPDVAATLRGLYGADVPGTLSIRPAVWAAGLAIAVIGTLVAAAQSLWLALAFVLASLPVIWWIGSLLSRSMSALAVEIDQIQRFDVEGEGKRVRSLIREIDDLGRSVSTMRAVVQTFSRFVPKRLVQQLVESGTAFRLGGSRRQVTILFTDIAGFTNISEHADPEKLMLYTSRYLAALTEVITARNGTVDKFVGDAVMAIWNAPAEDSDHVAHACSAVLACRAASHSLIEEFEREGWPAYRTRFGLHTGEAVVGNVGSSDRMSYTVLGATVNLAARLEALNKDYDTEILVSEAVRERVADRFAFRQVDTVRPKGFEAAVRVYELTE